MDYNSKNRYEEFERIFESEDVSISNHSFYIRYCRNGEMSQGDIRRVKRVLGALFPSAIDFQTNFHADLFKVVSIVHPEDDFIFGYAGIDSYKRVMLLPKHGERFIFMGVHNQEKFDNYISNQYVANRNQTVKFYHNTVASYLNNWLNLVYAYDLDMNFTVDYPTPIDRGKYVVNSFNWNTKLTDNKINIENY